MKVYLHNCVSDIKNKLTKNSYRKVGFFSDEFNGMYMYGKLKNLRLYLNLYEYY